MAGEKILIVDDEREINELISSLLKQEGYETVSAYTGNEAKELLELENPDLIILDFMLPDIEGPELCLAIRRTSNAPVLFLSCRSEEIDKIVSLSSGGDDYITKPFLPGELIARIKANLRRSRVERIEPDTSDDLIKFGQFVVDQSLRTVTKEDGEQIHLTNKEYDILLLLLKNPKRIFSADQVFKIVWKTTSFSNDPKTVAVHISSLRKKIEADGIKYIMNVKGIGYKFNHTLL